MLVRKNRLLVLRYSTLKNTVAFIKDLDKIMLNYNQRFHQSLYNHNPLEVHQSNNTLYFFLKQYSTEKVMKKKINFGDRVRINRTTNNFEKKNYLWSTELCKASKVLDTNPVTHRLRDLKDDEILRVFYEYELKKNIIMECIKLKRY